MGMTGKKGCSGGKREGAGRKPRTFRVKLGDRLYMNSLFQGRGTLGSLVEVAAVTRTMLTLCIVESNEQREGERINLLR